MPTVYIWYPDKDHPYGHTALQTDKYYISFWPDADVSELRKARAIAGKGVPASLVFHQELDRHYEGNRLPTGRYEISKVSDESINEIHEEFLHYNRIDPADVTLEAAEKLVDQGVRPEVSVSKTKFAFVRGNLPVDSYYQHENNCVSICYALIVTAYEKTFSKKISLGMWDVFTLRFIDEYTVPWFESHIKKHWVEDNGWNVATSSRETRLASELILPTVVASPTPNMASYKKIGKTGIKYTRENLLGQGNFGSVYLGIYNDQQVAVKRILLNRYEKEEREVNLQQNLDHENVLKILKVEEDDDFRYIVLELCAGTLGEVIEKKYKGPSYPSDPIVLYQIADGLDYIHSKKLIHRDIKPDNILISMNGQQLKLSDFGLSKRISNRDTCSMSGMKGTLLWMAPEFRGDDNNIKATPKCDVFPCGCVFFVFLTRENGGIHPFGDIKDHLKVQLNICSGNLINIDKLKADHYAVPVIQEMIKANPLERINFANVKERLSPFCFPDLCTSTKVLDESA